MNQCKYPMQFLIKHKKLFVISSIVIASIILVILITQFILGNILQNKIEDSLSSRDKKEYEISVGNVKVNLFTMTVILKDVQVEPDSTLINQIKLQKLAQKKGFRINIPILRVRYIGVIDFLLDKYVDVGSFVLKNAKVDLLTSGKSVTPKTKKVDKAAKPFNIDSIVIPGINGINLDKLSIRNFSFNSINVSNSDTIFSANKLSFTLKDIRLVKNVSDSASFKLVFQDFELNLSDERFNLPGGKYILSFDNLNFSNREGLLVFEKFKLKPRYSRSKMVSMSKFQYEIFDIEMEKVEVNSFYPVNFFRESKIFMSNVLIDKAKIFIFKDKRHPFDEEKRPKLPQQLLKSLKQDLFIDSLIINESELVYAERHPKMEKPMIVTLGGFNAKVRNITSISDSIKKNKTVMSIELRAKLEKVIPMGVNIKFPLASRADTFSFNGWLGKGDMTLFNPIVLPAIGVKFKSGELDGIKFSANANPVYSIGEMTMLYKNLDGVVMRNDPEETNKFLSWVANLVMIRNNPIKNKDIYVAPMFFNRVDYKGLGNFLWKTLQSGITATIIPTMGNKVQNEIYTIKGIDKSEVKKKTRKEKRKKNKK